MYPLIIDQPEENLDNEMVAELLVPRSSLNPHWGTQPVAGSSRRELAFGIKWSLRSSASTQWRSAEICKVRLHNQPDCRLRLVASIHGNCDPIGMGWINRFAASPARRFNWLHGGAAGRLAASNRNSLGSLSARHWALRAIWARATVSRWVFGLWPQSSLSLHQYPWAF